MRSINIYWDIRKRDKRRGSFPPLRKKRVQNRFTAVECAAAVAAISLLSRAPGGAYPMLPDAGRRMSSGGLKLKMNCNDVDSKVGGKLDA